MCASGVGCEATAADLLASPLLLRVASCRGAAGAEREAAYVLAVGGALLCTACVLLVYCLCSACVPLGAMGSSITGLRDTVQLMPAETLVTQST